MRSTRCQPGGSRRCPQAVGATLAVARMLAVRAVIPGLGAHKGRSYEFGAGLSHMEFGRLDAHHPPEFGSIRTSQGSPRTGVLVQAAKAAPAKRHVGKMPMEKWFLELSRVGGGSNHPLCLISNEPRFAQNSLYTEGSAKKQCKMLKTNRVSADTQSPGGKCGLANKPRRAAHRPLSKLLFTLQTMV